MSPRLWLLASLYFAQGLPFGFFTQAVPVVLREGGASLPLVGASSMLALPWALKFLWAPAVDACWSPAVGRRRSWILPLQALTVSVLLALAAADPTRAIAWLAAGMFVTSLLASTQDVATDALAVELVPPAEHGIANGVQVGAYRFGMILGGSVLLWVYEGLGWAMVFAVMAALVAAASVPVWRWTEPPHRGGGSFALTSVWRRGLAPWLAALVAFKLGDALAASMAKPLLVDAGLSLSQIGTMNGLGGSVAGMLGALAGGWAAGRVGARPALLGAGLAQAVGAALWILPSLLGASLPLLWAACLGEAALGGAGTAVLFMTIMRASRPSHAATDTTVQACAVVIATGAASAMGGLLAAAVGYPAHFAASAALALVGVAPLLMVARPSEDR